MCGRYTFELNLVKEIDKIYQLAKQNGYQPATGEIFPGSDPALVISKDNKISVVAMQWGFPGFKPHQALINARSETVLEKPRFSKPFLTQRCVYPKTGFFEWSPQHQKYWFNYTKKPQALYIAGFYNFFKDNPQSILLTTVPTPSVKEIHSRMPLILKKSQIKPWLNDRDFARKVLQSSMPDLYKSAQD